MQKFNMLDMLVIRKDLCSGCGTCAGVCSEECIKIGKDNLAESIDYGKCIDCNLCYRCCPSGQVRFMELDGTKDREIGSYISIFRGYACNVEIRKNGASGGMATAILSYMLDKKIVDCVVCADFTGRDAGYIIVSKSEELMQRQKSYYIPVPINLAIREMKKHDKKYAVIGTPCQIQGLTKAMETIACLKDRIVIRIGLFCGYIQRKESIAALAGYLGCNSAEWDFVGWRYGDYPGYVTFINRNTQEVRKMIIYDALSIGVPFYTLKKCFLCPDGTNEFADIVLGDVHAAGNDENVGIIRTQVGKEIISAAMEQGYVYFEEEKEKGSTYHVVKGMTTSKHYLVLEQFALSRRKGERIPEYINLDIKSQKKMVTRFFLKRKAKLYAWSSSEKGKKAMESMSFEEIMKIGKKIYYYPGSSKLYSVIHKLYGQTLALTRKLNL